MGRQKAKQGNYVLPADPKLREALYRKHVKEFEEESDLKLVATKRVLAESLAALILQRDVYVDDLCDDRLTQNAGRLLPGIISNIKRLCDTLGVTEPKNEVEEEEL